MLRASSLALLALSALCIPSASPSPVPQDPEVTVSVIPYQAQDAVSEVQFTYPGYGFDGPRISPINETVFDWWYFDAFSTDGDLATVGFNFYQASSTAYVVQPNDTTVLAFEIFGSFANGTQYWANTFPEEAVVHTQGNGSSGTWGPAASWTGSPDGKSYSVSFNEPSLGLRGTVKIDSIAPLHLPCGPAVAGGSESFMPNFGWANVIPDAHAQVNFEVYGVPVTFNGYGYHDKSWGSQPFLETVKNWYWGHGRLGPYSVVFYDVQDRTGEERFTSFISKDGEIVTSSCAKDSIVARPWGENATYPPAMGTSIPEGLTLRFDVDGEEFFVNTTNIGVTTSNPAYSRWRSSFTGGFEGEEWEGTGVCEEVKV